MPQGRASVGGASVELPRVVVVVVVVPLLLLVVEFATCAASCDFPLPFYTPGSDEHGLRFLTGGPGAAPGGVASKNGWVYMRVQGGFISYSQFVRRSVCAH